MLSFDSVTTVFRQGGWEQVGRNIRLELSLPCGASWIVISTDPMMARMDIPMSSHIAWQMMASSARFISAVRVTSRPCWSLLALESRQVHTQ